MADRKSQSARLANLQAIVLPLVIWGALNGIALFVLARRVSGLSSLRFSSWQIVIGATSFALLGLLASVVSQQGRSQRSLSRGLSGVAWTALPLLLLTATAAADRLTLASLCTAALAVIVTIALMRWDVSAPSIPSARVLRAVSVGDGDVLPATPIRSPAFSEKPGFSPAEPEEEAVSGQWLRRSQDAAGHDCLEGTAVGEFAAGRKQTVVHIAFCPPFDCVPKFSCEASADGVRARVAAVYPYGVRIELKRADCAESSHVEVEFSATSDVAARTAAAA